MVTRINPSLPALWRDPKNMQIGYGKKAVQLGNLSLSQEKLVAALFIGVADSQFDLIAQQTGNSITESTELLTALEKTLIRDRDRNFQLSPELVSSMFAEISRANLEHNQSGNQIVAMRATRKIFINELTASGLLAAQALASCGIGQIFTGDRELVSKADLGPCGYPAQLLGKPRITALRDLLSASPNQTQISFNASVSENVDAALLLGQEIVDPSSYQNFLSSDTPHAALIFKQDGLWFSGLVRPGLTPCLNCYLSAQHDEDSAFPTLASQLVNSKSRLDDTASRLFAAAIATRRLLQYLDSETTGAKFELGALQFNYSTPEIEAFDWKFAHNCTCNFS